jgi:lipopolysaccharide/colanic/teichoic acid biosynthesis glycosyltransferase
VSTAPAVVAGQVRSSWPATPAWPAGSPVPGGPAAAAGRGGPGQAGRAAKRATDLAVSAVLLALLAVPLLILGLLVRRQLRAPALFRQARVTGQGQVAQIIKLRTLRGNFDPETCWAPPAGAATGLGRFLRASHLDELPQLINVLRGEMSLVGPRPERPHFAERFAAEIPGYAGRSRMKAGLTGWAQVSGLTGDTSLARRAQLDNAYIDNWSLWLDLAILARTAATAAAGLRGRAATARSGDAAIGLQPGPARPSLTPAAAHGGQP